jgi:hypothetical protein
MAVQLFNGKPKAPASISVEYATFDASRAILIPHCPTQAPSACR